MVVFTIYDALTGNPAKIFNCGLTNHEFNQKYAWHNNGARVIFKTGRISEKGYYDSNGKVIDDGLGFKVIDVWNQDNILYDEHDGFMLLESVYQLMISHPRFCNLPDNYNLYDNLKEFKNHIWLIPVSNHLHGQTINVSLDKKDDYSNTICNDNYSWAYIDPNCNVYSKKNKIRINCIINYFLGK